MPRGLRIDWHRRAGGCLTRLKREHVLAAHQLQPVGREELVLQVRGEVVVGARLAGVGADRGPAGRQLLGHVEHRRDLVVGGAELAHREIGLVPVHVLAPLAIDDRARHHR